MIPGFFQDEQFRLVKIICKYFEWRLWVAMCSIELYVVFKCPLTEKYDLIELQANWIFISLT